jgi:hypothetical protein
VKWNPYPFQEVGIHHAYQALLEASTGFKQLYSAPTGSGKSVIELLLKARLEEAGLNTWIITPREEIVEGMLQKLEQEGADAEALGIWTPIRARNRLLSGAVRHPDRIIFDEAHHHNAESWQQLDLLTGIAPAVAYTASPFRGSPRQTRDFRDRWGEPIPLITYEEAIAEGIIRMPSFSILPLVDDDIVEVRGGEFDVTSLDGVTVDRMGDLVNACRSWYADGKWDKPTIFAFPSSTTCKEFQNLMGAAGMPVAIVSAETPRNQRRGIFDAVEGRVLALAHINIVSEGVDLKLRRLVDAAPTLSPVKWLQQLGRIMRPTPEEPEYICTNRNVLRHAYILEGIVPVQAIVDTEARFGPTSRAHSRVLGLEAIGRFKPQTTKLLNGAQLYVYRLEALVGTIAVQYACLVHPTLDPIWASKVVQRKEDGTKDYGSWHRCEAPEDLRGFASKGSKEPTERQMKWWERSAARYGLDPDQEVTRKSFEALPVLNDIGEKLP